MKRTLSEQEREAIAELANKSRPRLKSDSLYADGREDGFFAGYTACAETSVPIEAYVEVVEALKKAAGVINFLQLMHFNYHKGNTPAAKREADNHPSYLAAQAIIEKSKQYLISLP